MTAQFCSELSLEEEEPVTGTAPQMKHLVFVTWPKSLWHEDALRSQGLPSELPEWVKHNSAQYGKIALKLISNPDVTREKVQIFVYPGEHLYEDVAPPQIPMVLTRHFEKGAEHQNLCSPSRRSRIFICTHGRHDKCCAKFGQKIYQKFKSEIQQNQSAVEVWESTHLGGHRFASTLVLLPEGHFYGRVREEDVIKILACQQAQRVYSPCYRGNFQFSHHEQIVESYVQQYCFDQNLAWSIEIKDIQCIQENQIKSEILLKPLESHDFLPISLEMSLSQKIFQSASSCADLGKNDPRAGWVLEKMTRVGHS